MSESQKFSTEDLEIHKTEFVLGKKKSHTA